MGSHMTFSSAPEVQGISSVAPMPRALESQKVFGDKSLCSGTSVVCSDLDIMATRNLFVIIAPTTWDILLSCERVPCTIQAAFCSTQSQTLFEESTGIPKTSMYLT